MFTVKDPLEREVILKKETWENKIINITGSNNNSEHGNSHKEMANLLQNVQESIKHPVFIVKDTKVELIDGEEVTVVSENREEYYKIYVNEEKLCLNMIKTVVEFDKEKHKGEIVTTFKMDGKLSKVKVEGGVVYDASKGEI